MTATPSMPTMTVFRCTACHTTSQRPTLVCAQCWHRQLEPVALEATGVLVSWTTIRKPPLRFKAEGVYHVGVFDLDNGLRVTGRFLSTPTDQLGDRVVMVTDPLLQTTTPTFKVQIHG